MKKVPFELAFFLGGLLTAAYFSFFTEPTVVSRDTETALAKTQRILRAPAASSATLKKVKF